MKKTVAIIGSHPRTREDFDFSRRDCDIWTFNEVLGSEKDTWCSYSDAVFQIHKSVIWRSATNRNDPKHYEWLKSGDTPIVYMQDVYDDVPNSVKYPIDEILEAYPRGYFTSSVALALALAIYQGYERMEIYGVEMETSTEYGHQRNAVSYWIGFAEGLGIEVDMHSTGFFESPLYGYEGDIRIPIEYHQERIEHFTPFCDEAQKDYEKAKAYVGAMLGDFIKSYKTDLTDLDAYVGAMGQHAHNFGAVDGARQTHEYYLKKCEKMIEEVGTHLIVRQEFEMAAHNAATAMQEKMQTASAIGVEVNRARKRLDTCVNRASREKLVNEFQDIIDRWIKANTETGGMNGTQLENRHLMAMVDDLIRMAGGASAAEVMLEAEGVPA